MLQSVASRQTLNRYQLEYAEEDFNEAGAKIFHCLPRCLQCRPTIPARDSECQILARLQLQYSQNDKTVFPPVAEDGVNLPVPQLKAIIGIERSFLDALPELSFSQSTPGMMNLSFQPFREIQRWKRQV